MLRDTFFWLLLIGICTLTPGCVTRPTDEPPRTPLTRDMGVVDWLRQPSPFRSFEEGDKGTGLEKKSRDIESNLGFQ